VYPPLNLTADEIKRVTLQTVAISRALKVVGLVNIQFVIQQGTAYVLEVNPRASRTVPFLSKVTGVPMVALGTAASLGHGLREHGFATGLVPDRPLHAVKAPVFSMAKLTAVDAVLGPEMKSTGEAMGIARDLAAAQYKAFQATMNDLPPDGAALCSIADPDKDEAVPILAALHRLGFRLFVTDGTARLCGRAGLPATRVHKLREGHPNVVDIIRDGEVHLVVNTVSPGNGSDGTSVRLRDGYEIRRASVERRIPCLTSLDTARSLVEALEHGRTRHTLTVAALTDYLAEPVGATR
jgi:carbamoyl-phosphate synthase large subunit